MTAVNQTRNSIPPKVNVAQRAAAPREDLLSIKRRLASLENVIAVEDRVRKAKDEVELVHLIANETSKLIGARQVIVLRANAQNRLHVFAVSSVSIVDRDTPFIRWVEGVIAKLRQEQDAEAGVSFALSAFSSESDQETSTYPFPFLLWQPMKLRNGEVFAGILAAREKPWSENDSKIVKREAEVFAVEWQALTREKYHRALSSKRKWYQPAIALLLLLTSLLPVPMTTLATVEIIAAAPHRVTAPLDGVVHKLPVAPNQRVKAGQEILKFDDTTLRNRFLIAEQELKVAQSRHDKTRQAAFSDNDARHSLMITKNELQLKKAEREYAADQLSKSIIRAEKDGILIYPDRDRLLGRPVRTGERLMQIADPANVKAQIELPVADAIVLKKGASVRLFLDSDPLSSVPATLERTAYHAEPNSTQQLVYRLAAGFGSGNPKLRIGARGTAQLSGERVPLVYFLFRRPISAARQYFGL